MSNVSKTFDRGKIVIPANIRNELDIKTGDMFEWKILNKEQNTLIVERISGCRKRKD